MRQQKRDIHRVDRRNTADAARQPIVEKAADRRRKPAWGSSSDAPDASKRVWTSPKPVWPWCRGTIEGLATMRTVLGDRTLAVRAMELQHADAPAWIEVIRYWCRYPIRKSGDRIDGQYK
jgi:hypothetical protein